MYITFARILQKAIRQMAPFLRALEGAERAELAADDVSKAMLVADAKDAPKRRLSDLKLPLWAYVWRKHSLLKVRSDGMYVFLGKSQGWIFHLWKDYLYAKMTLPALCSLFVDYKGEPISAESVNKHGVRYMPTEVEVDLDRFLKGREYRHLNR